MDNYQERYLKILNHIWPTLGSNGFAEHNQTVNYASAYEGKAYENKEEVSVWYEFQIPNGEKRNNRIDGLIVNHTIKELYLIEAKRFSMNNIPKKKRELTDDFHRIMELEVNKRFEGMFVKNEEITDYKIYGVLLWDLWTETKIQKKLIEEYYKFCIQPKWSKVSELLGETDTVNMKLENMNRELLPMIREVKGGHWLQADYSYYLGAFIWRK